MRHANPFAKLLQSAGEAVPDATLVRRFVADRDHAAFELLVRRHADAVWTACRRILRHDADAEDAFQATFLALAKKAGSIRESGTLAGWLYKVAVNASLKTRNRRPDHRGELCGAEVLPDGRACEPGLDSSGFACEELARLSDKYRLPVVLCDLEGHTHAEAAAVLGWPVGTVSGRLSRARDQLKVRLLRRGVVGPALFAAVVADSTLAGRAAAVALGSAPVSLTVSTLSEGVLAAMSTLKLKLTAAVAAGLICVAGTGMYVATGQPPAPKTEGQTQTPVAGQPSDAQVRKVQKLKDGRLTAYPELILESSSEYKMPDSKFFERLTNDSDTIPESDIRQLQFERMRQLSEVIRRDNDVLKIGSWDVPFLNQYLDNVENLTKAAKEAYPKPADHIPWLRWCVVQSAYFENVVYQRVFKAENLRKQQYHQTDATRLKLELALYEAEVAARKAVPGR